MFDYLEANQEYYSSAKEFFDTFTESIYSGTINEKGIDPSGLYWLRFNWMAQTNKSQNSFLGHLKDVHEISETAKLARNVVKRRNPYSSKGDTKAFSEKAIKLREAALRNPFQNNLYQSHIFNLRMFINIVLQYQEHLSK